MKSVSSVRLIRQGRSDPTQRKTLPLSEAFVGDWRTGMISGKRNIPDHRDIFPLPTDPVQLWMFEEYRETFW